MRLSVFILLPALALSFIGAIAQWNLAVHETDSDLRGICNVGGDVIWTSGTKGRVLRSEDEGYMWQRCSMPSGADKLDFRGIYAWDANHSVVMSSGTGSASRLYETLDGGASWHKLFQNQDESGFWDAMAFRGNEGLLLGDPVSGRFVLFHSNDGGRHWERDRTSQIAALPGETLFAASNSSLVVLEDKTVLFATGGTGGPRVLRRVRTNPEAWHAAKVPMAAGKQSTGIFSLAFRDAEHGVAVGGDYEKPNETSGTAAWTADGGLTWHAADSFPSGYRSSVAWDKTHQVWIAVGPNGSDLSGDNGRTWKHFDSGTWNALSLPWVAGPKGRIGSLQFPTTPNSREAK